MDKETFSSYGWLVVVVIVIAVMIAFAPVFGETITNAVTGLLTDYTELGNGIIDGAASDAQGALDSYAPTAPAYPAA